MAVATHIADTSAMARMGHQAVEDVLHPLLSRGLLGTCGILNLEALYSAQSPTDYKKIAAWRNSTLEYFETDERDFERAQDIQAQLAALSMHRAVSLPDLIIAAVAERNRLTLLHYDADFDHVVALTGQAAAWVTPRGTL